MPVWVRVGRPLQSTPACRGDQPTISGLPFQTLARLCKRLRSCLSIAHFTTQTLVTHRAH